MALLAWNCRRLPSHGLFLQPKGRKFTPLFILNPTTGLEGNRRYFHGTNAKNGPATSSKPSDPNVEPPIPKTSFDPSPRRLLKLFKTALVLRYLKTIEPDFDRDEFLVGAKNALGVVLQHISSGNLEKLKPLVSEELLECLKGDGQAANDRGDHFGVTVVDIQDCTVVDAALSLDEGPINTVQIEIDITVDEKGLPGRPSMNERKHVEIKVRYLSEEVLNIGPEKDFLLSGASSSTKPMFNTRNWVFKRPVQTSQDTESQWCITDMQ